MFWRREETPRSEQIVGSARKTLDNIAKRAGNVQVRREERTSLSWLPGVLLGITAGITAGLLFAPQKGDQTRSMVQGRWGEYTKSLPERTGGVLHTVQGFGSSITKMFQSAPPRTRRRTPTTTEKEK